MTISCGTGWTRCDRHVGVDGLSDWSSEGRNASLLDYFWRLIRSTIADDILTWAAVIAFYGLFSLFPLLMLMLYVAALLLPGSHTEQLLVLFVKPYFPGLDDAQRFITGNIARLAQSGAKVGILSLLTLAWSASSAFISLQQAMDVIWNVREQRSYLSRRLIAFGMLLVMLLVTLGSAIVMAMYSTTVASGGVTGVFGTFIHHLGWLKGTSRILFPASLFIGCLVVYRYMPTRTTSWTYLLPGALVAAGALDLGRQLFVWYAGHMVTYQVLYGGLFAVMLVILWMYIGGTMMLFGAEISATLESWARPPANPTPPFTSDESLDDNPSS